jgi:hypothetical protein
VNKIEIFKPFEEAYELMKKILFRPFDLKKWFIIGFAAFLAHVGAGFNFNFNSNFNHHSNWRDVPGFQDFTDWIHSIPAWVLIVSLIVLSILVIGLMVVFAWLRARGRFIFIDCIVKNRGAIAEPWHEFRKEGNSYFLFALVVGLSFGIVVMALSLPFLLPILRGATFLHLHDVYLFSMIALWAIVILFLAFSWALIAHIMVVVMYRQRCGAVTAFQTALSLVTNYPGEITLYCLFWIVLGLGTMVVACVTACATCCLALLPYIGTVILLPPYVCLRAFSLSFLRQFGPDYDVWATLPPPQPEPPPLPV